MEEITEVPQDQIVVYVNKGAKSAVLNSETRQVARSFVGKLKGAARRPKSMRRIKVVFIVADDGCNYGRFVHVLDGAREAGAEVLGFATDRPDPSMFL